MSRPNPFTHQFHASNGTILLHPTSRQSIRTVNELCVSLIEGFELRVQESVVGGRWENYTRFTTGNSRRSKVQTMPSAKRMYKALAEKDRSFEGVFFIAVKTTGIFCRPGCPARTPLAKNVEFFPSAAQALYAGYRPCKKCRPMQAIQTPPDWLKPVMDEVDRRPKERVTDTDLRRLGVEPARVRRYFHQNFQMTFHAYQRARRLGMAMKDIRTGTGISTAGAVNGYSSESGFRDAFAKTMGVQPGKNGNIECLTARWLESPLGPMLAIADDKALLLLEFVDRRGLEKEIIDLRKKLHAAIVPGNNAILDRIAAEMKEYFAGKLKTFRTPIRMVGSEFQQTVWQELIAIPFGQTKSYSEMAKSIGLPRARRAVGRTNGLNKLAIIIPCHRVIRSDGSLCGYGGGLWRKKRLLEIEQGVIAS